MLEMKQRSRAERFAEARKGAGFTPNDIAREFSTTVDQAMKWERGKSEPPLHVIRALEILRDNAPSSQKNAEARQKPQPQSLIKSKERVADHGEVFTPAWLVEKMLDLVKGETERIDSRFLEPACGSGNFLVPVLQRKLAAVETKYGESEFQKKHYSLLALMSLYGIELLADNIHECRANLLEVFVSYHGIDERDDLYHAASHVLALNLIHGNAMTMLDIAGGPITVVEWSSIGGGKFNRRDFRLDVLTTASGFQERWSDIKAEASTDLFAEERVPYNHRGKDPIFVPLGPSTRFTLRELSAGDEAVK